MADIKVKNITTSLTASTANGAELLYLVDTGINDYKMTLTQLKNYVLADERVSVTKTLNGTINNGVAGQYVDVFSPTIGRRLDKVVLVCTGLLPNTGTPTIKVVLTNGTPANDVVIFAPVAVNELNETVKYVYELGANTVVSGFTLKLFVSGEDITAGTVQVITYYLPQS